MKDDSKVQKEEDNDNNEIDKYFEMDYDNSLISYENNDNDSKYTYNLESSINEENTINNQSQDSPMKQIDYMNKNSNLYRNSQPNNFNNFKINNNYNINRNSSIINNFNISNNFKINNNSNNFNIFHNNNSHSQSKNNSNINNMNINSFNKSNGINIDSLKDNKANNLNKGNLGDNQKDLLYPNLNNNNTINKINNNSLNNNSNTINYINNNNININSNNRADSDKKSDTKIIDNLSLSSSKSSNDIQIVSNEDFRKHFQEDRFGPQRRIQVVDIPQQANMPFSKRYDLLKGKINNNKDYNKCIDAFFFEDKDKPQVQSQNQNIDLSKKKIFNNPVINQNNKIIHKRKKFSPLPKEKYRNNNIFHKLLINRLEQQILTGIYDGYQNKNDFDETFYHIEKIKYLINNKGVEEAMKYMESIEPLSLRTKIIMESTYFFKEIIKEEVEFARNNNGKLILYKQSDYIYSQNNKNNPPLTGRLGVKRGRSKYAKNQMNKFITKNKNEMNNENVNYSFYNNFSKNPYMYKYQKPKTKQKKE